MVSLPRIFVLAPSSSQHFLADGLRYRQIRRLPIYVFKAADRAFRAMNSAFKCLNVRRRPAGVHGRPKTSGAPLTAARAAWQGDK
jgi:hypothetical protein